MILTLLIAIPLGVFAAYWAGTLVRPISRTRPRSARSRFPTSRSALVLAYFVGVKLRWLPTSGYVHPTDDLVKHFKTMVLPAISLAVGQIAVYMRLLRSDMIATLQEDFIRMAKAKGMPTRRVLWRHALRPSSLTLLTVAGLNVGALIGGAVVVEVIFGIPGHGLAARDDHPRAAVRRGAEHRRDHRDRLRARELRSSTSSTAALDPRIRDARAAV